LNIHLETENLTTKEDFNAETLLKLGLICVDFIFGDSGLIGRKVSLWK